MRVRGWRRGCASRLRAGAQSGFTRNLTAICTTGPARNQETEPPLNAQLTEELANAVERMPAFPKAVQRLLELTQDARCTPNDLIQVIERDPVLTVKLLKVVNSAYFGLPKEISSIGHAVVYLGFNVTKNLAVAMAAVGMLPRGQSDGFDWNAFLVHSLTTAALAKQLAVRTEGAEPMECFITGLLHDFGKLVLARFMPVPMGRALDACRADGGSLHLALGAELGTDHAIVGAMLAQKWRFSPTMVEAIRNQFDLEPKDTALVACVFGANQISKKLGLGCGGNPFVSDLPAAIAQRLGGTLEQVIASLGDTSTLHREALLFSAA